MLPSSKTIGIIGGGQLGKMLIEAGKPWNIRYAILDAEDAPAASIADIHIIGNITHEADIKELAEHCDILTYEIEHIHTQALIDLEKSGKIIIPSPRVLEIIQDKGLQKEFYEKHGLKTAKFKLAAHPHEWSSLLEHFKGEKVAVKLRKGGYDGKGVELMRKEDIQNGRFPFDQAVVLEEFIENAIELSVIVARNSDGTCNTFPVVEMEFDPKANLVEFLYAPAHISGEIENKARALAIQCAEALNGIGIFAVEMFLDTEGNIFVNEIAPRPHNSGHHTIEACYTSQYEQLNRILLGMPLGSTDLIQDSAMMNLLGFPDISGAYEITGLDNILQIPGVYIHLYNKKETRPKRKMGHITLLADSFDELKTKYHEVKNHIGMRSI